ncbi:GGDEF domain-containing protein [Ammoniphilus resinae]|uniref:Diguanylate cyclase (GGDEF)-like protein n=1 Tax=Ammoniphilus resinae TaxID=861532 RepID=A0ABS4GQM0_9BACL|nr:GGDEF domain-containing protein [Ammoniphilus resinae]MBP1932554.1 diguanylate cyclase (GGDEF)-like protein [Ammoniphilus resinae]
MQYDKAKFLAEKDVLTEVYNRRFVYGIFDKMVIKVNANHQKLSLFVVDVNEFKSINDTYGHEVGDEVLLRISNTLLQNTRKVDVVARWGGDEFLIIAPFTDREGTAVIIKRIEKELQELSKQMKADISVSIGTAMYPTDAKTLDDLIKVADKNMYQVKESKKFFQDEITYTNQHFICLKEKSNYPNS